MSQTGSGPMWVTRDDEVVSHLYFAAAEIGKATLIVGGMNVTGSLSFPNVDAKTIGFFSHGDEAGGGIEPGAAVRLEYSHGESSYHFLSTLVDVADQGGRRRWRVEFPKMIERDERRIVHRHRVMGKSGFSVMVGAADREKAVLYDISTAGVSFVLDPSASSLKVGTEVSATLHIPGCDPIATMLQLRNLRPLPGDAKRKLAGCRFVGMAQADQEELAKSMARLD